MKRSTVDPASRQVGDSMDGLQKLVEDYLRTHVTAGPYEYSLFVLTEDRTQYASSTNNRPLILRMMDNVRAFWNENQAPKPLERTLH